MKAEDRTRFKAGLQNWVEKAKLLKMATEEDCPVCDFYECCQHNQGGKLNKTVKNICPLASKPELCRTSAQLHRKLSQLEFDVWVLVEKLKNAHKEAGI